MMTLAPTLLVSVLYCSDEGAAFNAVRPAAIRRPNRAQLPASNNDNDAGVDRSLGGVRDAAELDRRAALARFAAAAGTAFLGCGARGAAAAEFSESPTSNAAIPRIGYDGKAAPPPPPPSPPAKEAALVEAHRSVGDFDGNEAGAVGATDEGTQPSDRRVVVVGAPVSRATLDPASLPQSLADVDAKVTVGSVVTLAVLAAAATTGEESYEAEGDGVEGEEKPSWALNAPVPYGIQNPSGANLFLEEVLEYCEGGKVSEPCAGAIKGYLDDVASTGAAATPDEAEAIAKYLDTLGDDEGAGEKKAGAAFTSYLDALSEGSAPPPSSAKAVKAYLDVLSGAAPAPEPVKSALEPAAAAAPPGLDLSGFDDRITSIEGRVTNLETKVEQIPDKVFAKVEAWQSSNEERLGAEVREIVEALAPLSETAKPVASVEASAPEPLPIVLALAAEPELEPAPIVHGTPIGEIPARSSMPQPMAGGPKKRYGFGGGASWKTATPAPSEPAASEPEPAPEPASPVVPANPVGEIPARSSMPQPMAGGPKKGYGLGGGAVWKTSESGSAGGGGGYLDNMGP